MLNSVRECLSSHRPQNTWLGPQGWSSHRGVLPGRGAKASCGGKRRSQDLMSGRITASSSASCMVTSGLIMYLVMEDQFLWLPRDATACLRVRGRRAAYRHDRQTLRGRWLPARGRTQIVLFGVTSGSHMKDQVADHIGGYACGCYGDLTGVSATRRSVAKPALVTISGSLASPASAPSAAPVSFDRELSCPSATI